MSELQTLFQSRVDSYEPLKAILLTDKDGVILVQAVSTDLPTRILESAFSTTFLLSSELLGKLGIGKNQKLISYFSNYSILQFNCSPLIMTWIAESDAEMGYLTSLGENCKDALEKLRMNIV